MHGWNRHVYGGKTEALYVYRQRLGEGCVDEVMQCWFWVKKRPWKCGINKGKVPSCTVYGH